jgi:hypothetical protein
LTYRRKRYDFRVGFVVGYLGRLSPKLIFLDEPDFFRPSDQQDARDVSERYIAFLTLWTNRKLYQDLNAYKLGSRYSLHTNPKNGTQRAITDPIDGSNHLQVIMD